MSFDFRFLEKDHRSPISRILSTLVTSQSCVTICLLSPKRKRHPKMIMRLIPEDSNRAGTLPLLCLAPREVYIALSVTFQPVSSYLTISPLPIS